MLHKHCGLDKWQIRGYTYPQIQDLLQQTQKHIQFEIETRMTPFGMFGGGGGSAGSQTTIKADDNGDYQEVTEENLDVLARVLGGG